MFAKFETTIILDDDAVLIFAGGGIDAEFTIFNTGDTAEFSIDNHLWRILPSNSARIFTTRIYEPGILVRRLGAGTPVISGDLSTENITDSVALGGYSEGGAELVKLKNVAGTIINPAKEDGNLAGIKGKTDNIPALGQALEAASTPVVLTAAQETTLTPPAAITGFALEGGGNLAAIAAAAESGLPARDTDATGADAYATVVTGEAREYHHIIAILGSGHDAIISLNGGTGDHIDIEGGTTVTMDGLKTGSSPVVQAKNTSAGENYTNLRIMIW